MNSVWILSASKIANEQNISYEKAMDEVVARACEMMLQDSKAVENLVKQNRTLAQKVLDFIKSFYNKVKSAFEGVEARTQEANLIEKLNKFNEVLSIWDKALQSAAENSKSAIVEEEIEIDENGDMLFDNRNTAFSIKENMSEEERYEILKNKKIQPQEVEIDKNFDIDINFLENNIKSVVEKELIKKLQSLGYLKQYSSNAIDVVFEFTGNGLRKSIHSQENFYGGNLGDFAKVVLNMQKLLDNSVLIDVHSDKGKGTKKEHNRLQRTFVLISAMQEGNTITPVQFEIMQYIDNNNRLYLAVALTKIEKTGVMGNTAHKNVRTYLLPVSDISITDLFKKINPKDRNLLKYIPNQFLNDEQIKAKERALKEDERKYGTVQNEDRDNAYMQAVEKGDTATAQKLVDDVAMDWGAYSEDGKTVDNDGKIRYNNKGVDNNERETDFRTDEFRRIQAESRGLSEKDTQLFHRGSKRIDERVRGRLSRGIQKELETKCDGLHYGTQLLNNPKTKSEVKVYTNVDAKTFYSVFEIVQKYLPSGDAVDVHSVDYYKNCKNYLTENGLGGFSITADGGNVASGFIYAFNDVFNRVKDFKVFKNLKTGEAKYKFIVEKAEKAYNKKAYNKNKKNNYSVEESIGINVYYDLYGENEANDSASTMNFSEGALKNISPKNSGFVYDFETIENEFLDNLKEIGYNKEKVDERFGDDDFEENFNLSLDYGNTESKESQESETGRRGRNNTSEIGRNAQKISRQNLLNNNLRKAGLENSAFSIGENDLTYDTLNYNPDIRYSIEGRESTENKELGEALYVINKQAKVYRDTQNALADFIYESKKPISSKETKVINDYLKNIDSRLSFDGKEVRTYDDFDDYVYNEEELESAIKDFEVGSSIASESGTWTDDYGEDWTEEEADERYNQLWKLQQILEEHSNLKGLISDLKQEKLNLYNLKHDVLTKSNVSPLEYHQFKNEDGARPYYQIGDFGFHGEIDENYNGDVKNIDVDKISSENKLADKMTFDEAKEVINKYLYNPDVRYSIEKGNDYLDVDEKLKDVINRLTNNENVSIDEINQCPSIQKANEISQSIPETYSINTPERQELRNKVTNDILKLGSFSGVDKNGNELYNNSVRNNRRIDLVIGLPAAGKSSVLVNPLSETYHSRVIDSDMAKSMLPEYNNGLGAQAVHQESKDIVDDIIAMAIKKGNNIVHPIVGGSSIKKLTELINFFKSENYSVYLHLNELPTNKAVARALNRFIETGRYIPPEILFAYENKPTQNYETIRKMRGVIDGYSRYSNDVEKGQEPIKIENSEGVQLLFGRGKHKSGRDKTSTTKAKNQVDETKAGLENSAFSIGEETDTDYMQAVEKGDTETAQKLVDEVAMQEGNTITPVQFEIMQYIDNNNRLYLAVALTKIEKTGVKGNTAHKNVRTYLLPVSDISITDLFKKINPKDRNLKSHIRTIIIFQLKLFQKRKEVLTL